MQDQDDNQVKDIEPQTVENVEPEDKFALAEMSEDEELFRLFVGPNVDRFMPIYNKRVNEKKFGFSFNASMLLAPYPWFFYRKMYVVGIVLGAIPLLLDYISPALSNANIGFFAALIVFSNSFYVEHVINRVRKLKALDLPSSDLRDRVAKEGGTSRNGAIAGIAMLIALLVYAFSPLFITPRCDSADVISQTEDLIRDRVDAVIGKGTSFKTSHYEVLEERSGENKTVCRFTLDIEDETMPAYSMIKIDMKRLGQELTFSPTLDELE